MTRSRVLISMVHAQCKQALLRLYETSMLCFKALIRCDRASFFGLIVSLVRDARFLMICDIL